MGKIAVEDKLRIIECLSREQSMGSQFVGVSLSVELTVCKYPISDLRFHFEILTFSTEMGLKIGFVIILKVCCFAEVGSSS